MKRSWGDIIQAVRSIHLDFYTHFPVEHPVSFDLAQNVQKQQSFQFPEPASGEGTYVVTALPSAMEEWIEFHPVERFLLEGPRSPIELIDLGQEKNVHQLFNQILSLENHWIDAIHQERPYFQVEPARRWMSQNFERLIKQFYHAPRLKLV